MKQPAQQMIWVLKAAEQRPAGIDPGRSGFTLLEVLVALSILGIALTVVLKFFFRRPAQHQESS